MAGLFIRFLPIALIIAAIVVVVVVLRKNSGAIKDGISSLTKEDTTDTPSSSHVAPLV